MNNKDSIFQCLRILFPFNLKGLGWQIALISWREITMTRNDQHGPVHHYLRFASEAAKMMRYENHILLKYPSVLFLFYNIGNRLPVCFVHIPVLFEDNNRIRH